jgi:hypothetical protein
MAKTSAAPRRPFWAAKSKRPSTKFEFRNSKQYQTITKHKIPNRLFEFSLFVSDFELRISNFVTD